MVSNFTYTTRPPSPCLCPTSEDLHIILLVLMQILPHRDVPGIRRKEYLKGGESQVKPGAPYACSTL